MSANEIIMNYSQRKGCESFTCRASPVVWQYKNCIILVHYVAQ